MDEKRKKALDQIEKWMKEQEERDGSCEVLNDEADDPERNKQ